MDSVAAPWPLGRARDLASSLGLAALVAGVDYCGAYQEAHNPVQGDPALKLPTVPGWAYVLVLVAALALVGRRRWPVATFATVSALTMAYTVMGYDDGAPFLAVAVALFSLAVFSSARATFVALGTVMVPLVLAEGLFSPFGWFSGPVTVLPFMLCAGAGLGFAAANRRSHLDRMRERAEEAERERDEETRRRVDAERVRIARELHDVVAHSMATVNVQAGVALHLLRDKPDELAQAMEAMETVRATSKEALREMRGILNLLRSSDEVEPTYPVPRLAQLADLVAAVSKAGLPTIVHLHGTRRPLPAAVDLAAYRVVQESLTNGLRHAGPAHAIVSLTYLADGLVVEVTDDGRGAAPGTGVLTEGNGLRGMAERAQAVGGTAMAGPRPEGGFGVRAFLPCPGMAAPVPPEPGTPERVGAAPSAAPSK